MAKQHSPGFLSAVEAVTNNVQHLPIDVYEEREKDVILIDVREDHEWNDGRLPNAHHLGKGIIERDMEKRFPDKNAHYVLYCGGGFRSTLAANSIQMMGYSHVWSLNGGFGEWKASGRSVTTEA